MYIWNYNSNFENLENEVKKLEGRRETVQHLVVDATSQGDEIFETVQDWLDSANQIIDEASVVIEENKQANTKCCKGLCPNPKKRFQLSKQATKKAEAVAGVHEVGKFCQVVSYHTIPEEIWLPSIKSYVAFGSRIPTLNNVLAALSGSDVNMVGVYGMGGIGKTTLAKEVARQAKEGTLFKVDEVVFVEVSEKPDLEKIQGAIADKVGLVFTESVAVDVANACGGMPIAIVTSAKSLRNKRVCEWNKHCDN
ncbi:hypothetical protein Ddye_028457 [Dipteronia dyeriana]|uniref:NB-ARC domain-containing protein n=1 Tax=Dipteronia dyeriana TaxID=168575 RepID=A0AAD9TRI6_9ROSI|nr:hypothetical protein Ddye_028457 [Dipteronia dyeriana]